MKKIAYIVGAGSTQAEAAHVGKQINLLMKSHDDLGYGVSKRVLDKASKGQKRIRKLLDIEEETDIEKLITLLTATGTMENLEYAKILKENYYREIMDSIQEAGVLYNPELAIALLQMHTNRKFSGIEELSGIISLNHDNLFQEASQTVHSCINLGFGFHSEDFKCGDIAQAPFLIQLHGSFSWRRYRSKSIHVVKIKPKRKYDPTMTWIPPSILKETKDYPFNKLTGLAYEILADCDTLRIVGCSLSQNDWNLISLIFNAQVAQYNDSKKCFKIELLMDIDFDSFKKEVSYLKNLTPIHQLDDGDFSGYKIPRDERPKPSELDNPFEFWLKTKVQFHISEGQFDVGTTETPLRQIIGM